ncbi:MAG: Gfo/Idh/MocA family oxidoreductase [Candidatus Rokubacteria bacterium]|nr:Gfo/Idh/MocA family oxidoreductase [Candidatus Rokubacteria bacterium]
MNIAIVGCGYVADFYMSSLKYHPELRLVGVYGRDAEHLRAFGNYYSVPTYEGLDELVRDPSVEMVLNLTNPRSHYEVTTQCLEAGKHVYSEKPLAMEYEAAKKLVRIAKENDVLLSSAPCSLLGETAQTIRKALQEHVIGPVRLVYANFDAGMTSRSKPWMWRSASGAPWPAKDEFEVGCTYEHAGYFLTWLAAFFGPAKRVTAFASCQVPGKGIPVDVMAPDFTVGCIEYKDGIVARVTCSLLAPRDRSLTIIGDTGMIYTKDMRDDGSPVYVRRTPPSRLEAALEYRLDYWLDRVEHWVNWIPWSWGNSWRLNRKYPFARKPERRSSGRYKPVDFCRGPAELADAIREKRPCRLSAELGMHITELIEALQYPERFGGQREIESTFDPIQPLPWDN